MGGANPATELIVQHAGDSTSTLPPLCGCRILPVCLGNTQRRAFIIKQRLLQELSHPSKTSFALTASSTVAMKHRSASVWLPVNRKASKYKGCKSWIKLSQKSECVA